MAKTTTDHDTIRHWAELHGGRPAAVQRSHEDDTGIIRLIFPDAPQSQHDALVEISWDEFFRKFDEAQLALVFEPKSNFNKLIGRDTAERRAHGEHGAHR
ncbi:hypothetical protein [Falsiroseomonas oryzae]|uniref:hypothetical protein n=1 Tax=Falsiroseomonas oryzae TaxID=2766473 RepID=UPI0022EAFC96|nr:hypothetical protein [Roseomonas sp. MO-31]